ncbi:hypothetical protein [Streptomyces sp. NPDC005017]|uniref:hypothetical protein n=1 Tax=Streptomyces sp. NPDC005017 TaxID=3364706 RepID=UPI0036B56A97
MNLRLLALAGVAVCAIALPLAVASADPADDEERTTVRMPARDPKVSREPDVDAKGPVTAPSRTPLLLGLGTATAARCGPELTSPEGVEAQTCVLTRGEDTWARAYYRNATGEPLQAALSLLGPGDRTVQTYCAVSAGDEPASCDTPRERSRARTAEYSAFAEFAAAGADGPLLLRSGSNS